MKNVLEEITRLRTKRNWSEYDLAKRSGLYKRLIKSVKGSVSPCHSSLRKMMILSVSHPGKENCLIIGRPYQRHNNVFFWNYSSTF